MPRKRKKYVTLDEALTIGTGLNAEQRQDWREKFDALMDKRAELKAAGESTAEIDKQIETHI